MADPPKELIEAIHEGRALIVCGAGVSQFATGGKAPGWKELINRGIKLAGADAEPAWVRGCTALLKSRSAKVWLNAADMIQEQLGGRTDGRYRAFLRESVGKLEVKDEAVFKVLRALGEARNRIATTMMTCSQRVWAWATASYRGQTPARLRRS